MWPTEDDDSMSQRDRARYRTSPGDRPRAREERARSPSVRAASTAVTATTSASTTQKRRPAHRLSRWRLALAARRARWNRHALHGLRIERGLLLGGVIGEWTWA